MQKKSVELFLISFDFEFTVVIENIDNVVLSLTELFSRLLCSRKTKICQIVGVSCENNLKKKEEHSSCALIFDVGLARLFLFLKKHIKSNIQTSFTLLKV